MRFIMLCLSAVVVSIISLSPAACMPEPIASVIPGEGRMVGLLEWVEAELVGEIKEEIDPDRCEMTLEGPAGVIAGDVVYVKGRLKFVPVGTRRINMDDEAVTREGEDISVQFEGTSIGAGVIQGPDGNAWDWCVDENEELRGRFDLYLPSRLVGHPRYWDHTEVITGGLQAGEHELRLSPAESNANRQTPPAAFWIHSRMSYFVVSPLPAGPYTATVIARGTGGAELGRQEVHFLVDPLVARHVTAYVETAKFANIFTEGESLQLTVTAHNAANIAHKVQPLIEIRDFWSHLSTVTGEAVAVPPGESHTWTLDWPSPLPGWYLCTLRLTTADGAQTIVAKPMTVAVLPRAEGRIVGGPPLEGVFDRGINGALAESPEDLFGVYQRAGFQFDQHLPPTPENVARAAEYGIEPGLDWYTGPWALRWAPGPEQTPAELIAKVKEAAGRVGGLAPGTLYASGDEGDIFSSLSYQAWAAGQKLNALIIKRLDPTARLTPTQAGAWHNVDFFLGLAEQGAWPYIDVLNVHLYFGPRMLKESLDLYDWMLRRLGTRPAVVGLWNTVVQSPPNSLSAFPFDEAFVSRLRHQAIQGFEQRIICRRYPWVERIWHWNAYDYFECPHHSILFWDKTPKPLYVTIATITWKLGGASYVGSLDMPRGVKAEVFDRRGQAVVALRSDKPRKVTFRDIQGPVTITNIMGQSEPREARGTLRLTATPEPVLVEVPGNALLDQAYADAERLGQAGEYWRRHAIVLLGVPGRGTRTEAILPAGEVLALEIWIANEGEEAIRGRMSLAREAREGDWYSPRTAVLDGAQSFEVEPGEQAKLTFRVKANDNAGTFNLTLRTKTYLRIGTQEIFLDPTTIDIIVVAKAKGD